MTTQTQTHSGKMFDIFNPKPEDICIEDIAHALSMQCRFNGHTKEFYSVAEHSLNCARIAASIVTDAGGLWRVLMHDAHETYLGDIPGPWKKHVRFSGPHNERPIWDIQDRIDDCIADALLLQPTAVRIGRSICREPDLVSYCDLAMLLNEKGLALQVTDIIWGFPPEFVNRFTQSPEHLLTSLDFYKPAEACFQFLKAYQEITQCLQTGSPVSQSSVLSLAHLRT